MAILWLGESTSYLINALDSVQELRGFKILVFVDIRVRPLERIKGFKENSLKNLVGEESHQAMPELGNKRVVSGSTQKFRWVQHSPSR